MFLELKQKGVSPGDVIKDDYGESKWYLDYDPVIILQKNHGEGRMGTSP